MVLNIQPEGVVFLLPRIIWTLQLIMHCQLDARHLHSPIVSLCESPQSEESQIEADHGQSSGHGEGIYRRSPGEAQMDKGKQSEEIETLEGNEKQNQNITHTINRPSPPPKKEEKKKTERWRWIAFQSIILSAFVLDQKDLHKHVLH